MSLVLLGASAALAAAPVAGIAGLAAPRSVALLVQKGDEVAAIACNDAGTAPDEASDAIWSCGPLPPSGGLVRLGVVVDGRLLDAGTADIGGARLFLQVAGGAASIVPALPPGGAASPNPGVPTVVARVSGLGEASAPVVRLQGPAGAVELMCRDDGVFPDDGRNDGVHGCAGPAPGARGEVFVNGKDGATRSFGKVEWSPAQPLAFLVVDGAAGAARIEVFRLDPFPVPEDVSGAPPAPVPVAPPGAAGTPPPPPPDAPERSPVATHEALPAQALPPVALLVAFVLGAGGALAFTRRAARIPPLLHRHPAPPLLPGGPSLADGAVAVTTADPVALAATLLPALARHRRVVLVAAPGAVFPPVADGPVYRAAAADCQEVEAAVRALVRTPGPPVAVLIVGESLTDPGAIAPDPLGKLREGLGAAVWLGVLLPRGAAAPGAFAAWTAERPHDSAEQVPWALTRATLPG